MAKIKLTFIDTPAHGYLKVMKQDLRDIGYPKDRLDRDSQDSYNYSTRDAIYYEEDSEAGKLATWLEDTGAIKNWRRIFMDDLDDSVSTSLSMEQYMSKLEKKDITKKTKPKGVKLI